MTILDTMKQARDAFQQIATTAGRYDTPGAPNHMAMLAQKHADALHLAIEQAEKQRRATAIDTCPYDTSPATDYWIEGWQARAALEQAERQEPVASAQGPEEIWLQLHGDCDEDDVNQPVDYTSDDVTWCWHSIWNSDVRYVRADLAAPPQRQPLTDERIDAAVDAWFATETIVGNRPFEKRMRAAIEAAHGITGEQK